MGHDDKGATESGPGTLPKWMRDWQFKTGVFDARTDIWKIME